MATTYFEGQANRNTLAARGYSRDHRPDWKQVRIGLVVSREGYPLGYEVFAGNRSDGPPCGRSSSGWSSDTAAKDGSRLSTAG
jgi:hypothetical protein